MCMLTAMVPIKEKLSPNDVMLGKYLFTSLVLRNGLANRDGFGLASTKNNIFKTASAAGKVMFSISCITAVTSAVSAPMIGHVRTTSTGRTARDGSHPFLVGPLAVAHNGTFTNYRKLLKDNKDITKAINDPDPVDSNVFAHLLWKVKGKGTLTSGHIETALKEMSGSYAILVAEKEQDFIWVIRGGNSLYQAIIGPYQVINTSKINLESAGQEVANTFKLLFGSELEEPDVTLIESYGVYKMYGSGLVKEMGLPKPPPVTLTTTYNYTGWQGTGSTYTPGSISRGVKNTEEAITNASFAMEITSIKGVTYEELEIATTTLCGSLWWETKKTDLVAIKQTLEDLSLQHYTAEKGFVWAHICKATGDSPYESVENILTLIGAPLEVCFPYFVHTLEELQTILSLTRGGDNVIIS